MEVAMPMTCNVPDNYEDMFREITKKLYGDEPQDQTVEKTPSYVVTPLNDYEVDNHILKTEESFTLNLASLIQNGFPTTYGVANTTFSNHKNVVGSINWNPGTSFEEKWFTSDDCLQWTQNKIASYSPSQKLFKCLECNYLEHLNKVAEHWLGDHSNLNAFRCPQCSFESGSVKNIRLHLNREHNITIDESSDILIKDNPVLQDIVKYLQRFKNKFEITTSNKSTTTTTNTSHTLTADDFQNLVITSNIQAANVSQSSSTSNSDTTISNSKKYSCLSCPYATDRRDLFTRHENIHREEKPFQCYVCQKQFNRADHVKKHFLRMHRDHPYDLNRIRRHPPKNASGMSYYQKYNSTVSTIQPESINCLANMGGGNMSISGFNGGARTTSTITSIRQADIKSMTKSGFNSKNCKKKGEKRFSCIYCPWSGVDNWCLKRHMNTHSKPFACGLCDYKAARSERLSTHVLKVHNKRVCSKCNILTDDITQLTAHQQEQHPLESRNRALSGMVSAVSTNVIRNHSYLNNSNHNLPSSTITSTNANTNRIQNGNAGVCSQQPGVMKNVDLTVASTSHILHGNRFLHTEIKTIRTQIPKKHHGAARLFNYMEASDSSETETESSPRQKMADDDLSNTVNLTHQVQTDFLEAGGVEEINQPESTEAEVGEETGIPSFVCQTCGCEFEDDFSLETHQFTHQHVATSPAKNKDVKENVDPHYKYSCKICKSTFNTQFSVMQHMNCHTSFIRPLTISIPENKRSRKQSQPKKILIPYWNNNEVEVLRHITNELKRWRDNADISNVLVNKYMAQLVTRKGLVCRICRTSNVSRFHTKASLALHHLWKHSRRRYHCEHCNMIFRHKYQALLHSSRVHILQNSFKLPNSMNNLTVIIPQIKENATHLSLDNVVSAADLNSFTNFFNSSHNVAVPDANVANAHKLGMSFFDHSFIHNNVTNHMPIIIPTFPPN